MRTKTGEAGRIGLRNVCVDVCCSMFVDIIKLYVAGTGYLDTWGFHVTQSHHVFSAVLVSMKKLLILTTLQLSTVDLTALSMTEYRRRTQTYKKKVKF